MNILKNTDRIVSVISLLSAVSGYVDLDVYESKTLACDTEERCIDVIPKEEKANIVVITRLPHRA